MADKKKSSQRKYIICGIALLAVLCILVLLVFRPFARKSPLERAGIQEPMMTESRGASEDIAEISKLMKQPNYKLALVKTEKSLNHLEMQIKEFDNLPAEYDDEETAYEEQQDYAMAAEMRWTYIYLLVKDGRDKDAIRELKRYIKQKEYAEHLDEAKKLLQELKN